MKAKKKAPARTKRSAAKVKTVVKARKAARKTKSSPLFWFKQFHPIGDALRRFGWIMPAVAVVATVGLLLRPTPTAKVPLVHTSAELESLFQKAKAMGGLQDRISFWSAQILKKPGLLSHLGAGPKINDLAPLMASKYDCTTYIETVGALAKSASPGEFYDHLISIRYKGGDISYEGRNHFPEIDWIPNNSKAGHIRDITAMVADKGGLEAPSVTKRIYKLKWFKAQNNAYASRALAAADGGNDGVEARVQYIPLSQMMNVISHVPQGSVINIVRNDRPQQPVLITHQGFLVWKGSTPYFRHVTREKRVVEVPFAEYASKLKNMPWQVLGFNVNAYRG
jgi:hypothetical protein